MAHPHRRTCMSCGRRDEEVGPISWRGNCEACGIERVTQAATELHEKRGPMYRRWQSRLLASVAALPADSMSASTSQGAQ